jgi:GTPase SAR1 family protein
MVLVGNKTDLAGERVISYEEGKALAAEFQIPFFEASAKGNNGVHESFTQLVKQVNEYVIMHRGKKIH